MFSKNNFTGEHMDITETPNSKLTITAYIALTNQLEEDDSKLILYPKSHLYTSMIPVENFDYISSSTSLDNNLDIIGDINDIVKLKPGMKWGYANVYIICSC